MADKFDYFVIFAEMRTGSNFLESNLNSADGISCYGELFNPHFIGHAGQTELLGMTIQQREAEPLALVERIKNATNELAGFRFFHDHDPRVLAQCLADRRCAKIVLTRNPLDTYVSREIVRQTGQWRLGDLRNAKTASVHFDAAEFSQHLETHKAFQSKLQLALQTSGQTAFYIGYDDIANVDVTNGLVAYLGGKAKIKAPSQKTKKQNPKPLEETVENFQEMEKSLTGLDLFDLNRTPNFEPRRGPGVPGFVAAAQSPVLFMPIRSGPRREILQWLANLDGGEQEELITGFTQKSLRQWKRQSKGHCCFTVVRHPVARLHKAFVRHILVPGPDNYAVIRKALQKNHKIPIPEGEPGVSFSKAEHRAAFLAFAEFIQGNLNGQSSIRVDVAWASQTEILQGFAKIMLPDVVIRENELAAGLGFVSARIGQSSAKLAPASDSGQFNLSDIYDSDVEAAVRSAYQRDYMNFGFGQWTGARQP